MFGTHTHGGFHDTEVAIFLGRTHGIPMDSIRHGESLKKSPTTIRRSLIVIDPRRTETADLADYWLQVKPGTDAFLLAALAAILVC